MKATLCNDHLNLSLTKSLVSVSLHLQLHPRTDTKIKDPRYCVLKCLR